jgi:glutamate-1-semialdehyde 2,1-aminomutase
VPTESPPSFAGSAALAERARAVLPSGVTHDMRYSTSPIYVDRARGSRKWDVDGNEYVDYWMGHGSLLLGHLHPEVIAAVQETLTRATHPGASHALEIEWAEMVTKLLPSAERVRFTASGTESTMLAMRLARASTGRSRIVKFEGHFHGWHDYATHGVNPPFDRPTSLGVPDVIGTAITVVPADLERVRAELAQGDVAGVILEPTGASMGVIPLDGDFLASLRALCDEASALLVFDEVITAFRFAPGGAQELTGVLPDLTALGKVLAGGLPGGAVAGRGHILDQIAYTDDPDANRLARVAHTGTFNASPPVAAAGVTTLRLVEDGVACRRAAERGAQLREGLAEAVRRHGAPWAISGESSIFHWLPENPDVADDAGRRKAARGGAPVYAMRAALLRRGVDFPGYEGWLSAEHTVEDIDFTIAAFDDALSELVR